MRDVYVCALDSLGGASRGCAGADDGTVVREGYFYGVKASADCPGADFGGVARKFREVLVAHVAGVV